MTQLIHPDLRVMDRPLFANITPDAMALVSEGLMLSYRSGSWVAMPEGVLWAALRTVERGEATAPALAVISSDELARWRTRFSGLPGGEPIPTLDDMEIGLFMNAHNLLPTPPCQGDTCEVQPSIFNTDETITCGRLLAEIFAQHDFNNVSTSLWAEAGHDLRKIHDELLTDDGFVATEALIARGRISDDKQLLYAKACELAESRGMWFLRGIDVQMAAVELGTSELPPADQDAVRQRYADSVEWIIDHVESGGCNMVFSFPGPRPWGPSAAKLLGALLPDHDTLLAPWPTKADLPALIKELSSDDEHTRWWTLERLSRLKGDAAPAVGKLIDLLQDKEPTIRSETVFTLMRIGPAAADAVDALIEALDDRENGSPSDVITALDAIGPASAPATTKLLDIIQRRDPQVGRPSAALLALANIAPDSPHTQAALLTAMDDEDEWIRTIAMTGVARCCRGTPQVVAKFIACLQDEDPDTRWGAARALEAFGPDAVDAIPALIESLCDDRAGPDPDDNFALFAREAAAEALGTMGALAEQAVPALMEAVENKVEFVEGGATIALGKIGDAAANVVPILIERLQEPQRRKTYLANALSYLGPAAKDATEAMIDLLANGKTEARAAAAFALGHISAAPATIAALTDRMAEDSRESVRAACAAALTTAGTDHMPDPAQRLRPTIDAVLAGDDAVAHAWASYALACLDPSDRGLERLLQIVTPVTLTMPFGLTVELLGELGRRADTSGPTRSTIVATLQDIARNANDHLNHPARLALNRIRNAGNAD